MSVVKKKVAVRTSFDSAEDYLSHIDNLCSQIVRHSREARFYQTNRIALSNRLLAHARVQYLGFAVTDDEEQRKKAASAASALLSALRKNEEVNLVEDQREQLQAAIRVTDEMLAPVIEQEEYQLKCMEKLAQQLPGYQYVKTTTGFGIRSFARIIGETGGLHHYANIGRLYKRLGLAVIEGERQRKYLDKEKAIAAGYNPRRRAVSWVMFDAMFRHLQPHYRELYEERKAFYLEREDAIKAEVEEGEPTTKKWSKLHADRCARRYVEKRVILHLWQEWRKDIDTQLQKFLVPEDELESVAA